MAYIVFILILVALILVHEAGHFFAAKIFGIRVDEFAVGFPPQLFSVRRGETKYSVNLLLLGGFVRIHGERGGKGHAHDPRSLLSRSRLVQALVVVAGIAMNLIFAWLLLSAAYMLGMPTEVSSPTAVGVENVRLMISEVLPGSPAARAGIKAGDVVLSMQTGAAELAFPASPNDARAFVGAHPDESEIIKVTRGGAERIVLAKPAAGVVPDEMTRKALGVGFTLVGVMRLPAHQALATGADLAWRETAAIAQGLGTFFAGIVSGNANLSQVSGPVGIAKAGATAATEGANTLLLFAALISINLALINVLPIPGLDGGRLLVLAVEGVRRKPISERLNTIFTLIGFALLILLMVVVTYHDIARLFP